MSTEELNQVPDLPPTARDAMLIRPDPAKSALADCIKTINDLQSMIAVSDKGDSGLFRELRSWEDRRLQLEREHAKETAHLFWPPGMSKDELKGHLLQLLDLVEELE